MENLQWIAYNTRAHDRIAGDFDRRHDEIFNPVEQERLRTKLDAAARLISTDSETRVALDYGAGTGNVTRHLLDMRIRTVAADVSSGLLDVIRDRYGWTGICETQLINGEDLGEVSDEQFDMVTAYSVLHHVPDYLRAVREMIRVLKPGGVLYLDHEHSPRFWSQSHEYRAFVRRVRPPWKWAMRLLSPMWYKRRFRALVAPGCFEEGDIHVWPHDHVEWTEIEALASSAECEVVLREDYLLYKPSYPTDVYERYASVTDDTRVFVARKER